MTKWDVTTDVLVVGSGGGGMTAALTAKDRGNDTLVIEKSSCFGGSTAMSGGAIWIPDNPLMKTQGINDSHDEALNYLKTITKGIVSEDRLSAYIKNGAEMVDYLTGHSHVKFSMVTGYSDYYPTVEGSKPEGGRTLTV